MYHNCDYRLPHNHAARIRGRLSELANQVNGLRPCDDSDDSTTHGSCPPSPDPPATLLIGVAAGSSITVGTDGVVIGTQSVTPGTASGGRIVSAWDADGRVLERIEALGDVPDPTTNETMTVSYDTPTSALHFKVRDRNGRLKTMVLPASGRSVTAIALRPSDAFILPPGVRLFPSAATGRMPFLRFDGGGNALSRFVLHDVPGWAEESAFEVAVTLVDPPTSADITLHVGVEFAAGGQCGGTVRIPRGQRGATAELPHSSTGFRVCADGVRRPRCGTGFGAVCTETVGLRISSGGAAPVDIAGARMVLHPF